MADLTNYPPFVADDVTLRTLAGPENITTRRALNFDPVDPLTQSSHSTPVQETMRTIMDQAKQNEQWLEEMEANNKRLCKELALELAKSQRTTPYHERDWLPEQRKDNPRFRHRKHDSSTAFNSLAQEPRKKGCVGMTSSFEGSPYVQHRQGKGGGLDG